MPGSDVRYMIWRETETLKTWIEGFLRDCRVRELSPFTVEYYRAQLANFATFCNRNNCTTIQELTPDLIRTWLLELRETHNAGGVNAKYRALRAFLNWWQEETDSEKNPITKVKPPKVERPLIEGASLEDIRALLATCGDGFLGVRDRALMLCLLDSGARAREFLAVDFVDVDQVEGSLILRKTKGKQARTVFIGRKSRKALRAYLKIRRDTSPALWVSRRGDRLAIPSLQGLLKRRGRLANLKNGPSAHDFRRAMAINYLRNGGDVFTLQLILGHKSLAVLRRYLALTERDTREAHARYSPVDRL